MSHFPANLLLDEPKPVVVQERSVFSMPGDTKAERRKTSISAAIGKEPRLSEASSPGDIIGAFNWYTYTCDTVDSKKYTLHYIKTAFPKGGAAVAKKMSALADWEFGSTGWMARQISNGHALPADYTLRFEERLKALNAKASKIVAVKEETAVAETSSPSLFSQQASRIIAEIDAFIDNADSKKTETPDDMYAWLGKLTSSPTVLAEITRHYKPFLDELEHALRTRKADPDDQVQEAYAKVKKPRIKKQAEILSDVLTSIDRITINKKSARKPRAKKAKTAIQQTKNMKYKATDATFKLTSIAPSEAVGTLQLWVFNTKTRKLGVYIASDTSALTVKGTSVQNFNEGLSFQKKLRKPEAVLTDVLGGTKVALRKIMDGIKSKPQTLNGRINSDTVLLRSIK